MSTDRQRTLQVQRMADRVESDIAFEDAGGLSALSPQKQAPVRFDSLSAAALGIFGAAQWRNNTQFALMLLASLSNSNVKADSPSQLLAATVDTLVGVSEEQFLDSLTEEDRQRFVTSLDKLIDVVGENETHPLAPLMNFIGNLIEKCEENFDMKEELEAELNTGLRSPAYGLETAYDNDESEYTLDMLSAVNSDYEDASEKWGYGLSLPDSSPEEASNDAEYTLDMLSAVNSDYEDASEKWGYK